MKKKYLQFHQFLVLNYNHKITYTQDSVILFHSQTLSKFFNLIQGTDFIYAQFHWKIIQQNL